MNNNAITIWLAILLWFAGALYNPTWAEPPARAPQAAASATVSQRDVAASMKQAKAYLLTQFSPFGPCKSEYTKQSRYGGKTALALYALATAGVDFRTTPVMRKAFKWLIQQELTDTYAVAMRTMALASLNDSRAEKMLRQDADWLLKACDPAGRYSYRSAEGKPLKKYDNSNTQLAVMALATAAEQGVSIPKRFWQQMEKHWLAEQQADGGWGYCLHMRNGRPFANPYGSMTASGIASLSLCRQQLSRQKILRCLPMGNDKALQNGLNWLDKYCSIRGNPRKGQEYFYMWLFTLQRVGELTGRKQFSNIHWYAQGANELLRRQNQNGSWGYDDGVEETSLALLFLARGSAPIFLHKIAYPGRWNSRPRDAANATRWLSYIYERPLGWDVIDITAKSVNWQQGRVAYLSGAGPMVLTGKQIERLREFVQRGGIIVSESACDNADFTLDTHKLYQKLFPGYRLQRLNKNHPAYTMEYKNTANVGLMGISNGVRPLAIHAPKQISLDWQMGISPVRRPTFNLLANLYLYLTSKGRDTLNPQQNWPEIPDWQTAKPAATIRLARLRYKGNWNPEPAGWSRLSGELAAKFRLQLQTESVDIEKLSPFRWPVAHITGTGTFQPTAAQKTALKRYIIQGGILLGDAAGGDQAFAKSFTQWMQSLEPVRQLPAKSPIFTQGPYAIRSVKYRRLLAGKLSTDERNTPRLEVLLRGKKPAVLFSPYDLSAGLVGYPLHGLKGYQPSDAYRIITNLLFYGGNVKLAAEKKSTPQKTPLTAR